MFKGLDHLLLPVLTAPTSHDTVSGNGLPLGLGQVEGILHGAEVVEDVTAEVGRIVAVDAELDAPVEVGADGQLGDVADAAQLDVAEGTHCHEDVPGHELGHDVVGGLGELDAVVDALDVQLAQRLGHVRHVGLLAGVGGAAEPAGLGVEKGRLEQGGRVAQFRAAQAEAPDGPGLQIRQRRGVHCLALVRGQVPQDAHDELRGEVEVCVGAGLRRLEAREDGRVRDPARRVGLRVEEDFGVRDPVGRGPREVGVREGFKVCRGHEHRHADEVVVEKVVEGGEAPVAREQAVDGREGRVDLGGREGDVVPFGECEEEVGFEGTCLMSERQWRQ